MSVIFILPTLIVLLMIHDVIESLSNVWESRKKKKLTQV